MRTFRQYIRESSEFTYDWRIATRAHKEAVDNHPKLEELKADRKSSGEALRKKHREEISGMEARGERVTQDVYDRHSREWWRNHDNHEASIIERQLHQEHNPFDYHTTEAAKELLGVSRAAAGKKLKAMQAGETPGVGTAPASIDWVNDTIQNHFINFNQNPRWGGSVPFDRFKSRVRYTLEDMREG